MLQFLVLLVFVSSVRSVAYPRYSAASPGQIQFAYENKFDDTGPGAKEPQYAYKTYKTLDDALIAYADDRDTKLPDHEKARAIANLYRKQNRNQGFYPYSPPKRIDRPMMAPFVVKSYTKFMPQAVGYHPHSEYWNGYDKDPLNWKEQQDKAIKVFAVHHFGPLHNGQVKGVQYQYKPHPDVEFSVDVHDKETGDLKSAHELQDGSGAIHGYYTFLGGNGQRRQRHTVHYQSDPVQGFKSAFKRIY